MTSRIILVGAGGFGREVLSWAHDAHTIGTLGKVDFFIDDNPQANISSEYDCTYLGTIKDLSIRPDDKFLLGISSPNVKRKIFERFSDHLDKFLSFMHPSAVIAKTAKVGRGVVICPFALVSADTKILDFVTINVMSSIGHDSVIGNFSTLSGHVDVTGQVTVGDEVFFGTGSKVVPRIQIGAKSKIGAGCTVMKSVPENSTYFTQPAKKLF
jgi:sugar O-acyltransferase (sialic acid O-acetyltransferase NeuD family)